VKKQSKSDRKSADKAAKHVRKAAVKAEAKAHRDAVKAELHAHRATLKAEALAHKPAVKAKRRTHKPALYAHVVVAEPPVVEVPRSEPKHPPEAFSDQALPHADAHDAYEDAKRALEVARVAFAEMDLTTHTREDWIAASARLRAAWAAVDVARSGART
jgi:hypothetical protein